VTNINLLNLDLALRLHETEKVQQCRVILFLRSDIDAVKRYYECCVWWTKGHKDLEPRNQSESSIWDFE